MAETKRLFLARERGFCRGVRSALAALERMLDEHPGKTVYVLHELVHNRHVTESFMRRGVRFVSEPSLVPEGAPLLLGAHGIAPEIERMARERTAFLADACCPLVRSRQLAASRLSSEEELILLGYPGHPEVVGIIGHSGAGRNFVISSAAEAERLPELMHPVLLSQTTFESFELERCREALSRRFPQLDFRGGVCPASEARQRSVAELAPDVELVVVAGTANSSNARRLCEAAERAGRPGLLVEHVEDLPDHVFGLGRVGLTAGASTPEPDVEKLSAAFADAGFEITDLKRT